jgi:hypothetical protein
MSKKTTTVTVERVDVVQLHLQKERLIELLDGKPADHILWGLVNFIDVIDDRYFYTQPEYKDHLCIGEN